ncbi:MAG: AMP-binding protein [Candidatus Aminicenantes bacterium]|nr:AMP-binding protein [Candidatus Aminicenantes bacterium]
MNEERHSAVSALTPCLTAWFGSHAVGDSGRLAGELLAVLEEAVSAGPFDPAEAAIVRKALFETGRRPFLRALGDDAARARWAESALRLIRGVDYSLLEMFQARVEAHPEKALFRDASGPAPAEWSYRQVERKTREIAAAFFHLAAADEPAGPPRVALFADNGVENACADLACLFYDILDTPINTHFSQDNLIDIFDRLGITLAVTDSPARRLLLEQVREKTAVPFRIVALDAGTADESRGVPFLGEVCKRLGAAEIDARLAGRRRFALDEVATVLFTSGSTGRPKGVSFSIYNLTAKRFARAAALPDVGEDEVFLCFLPLYHTFGRYLELLGSIYWGGTYVASGNPSPERLFSLFPQIRPTGFISVPIRWAQLYEVCLEAMEAAGPGADPAVVLRRIVGPDLRWGLSAAGFLDPKVFRFFEKSGIALCSGFGMTEATGGITMTPPGRYVDNAHGLPLPGIEARLTGEGELEIRGAYVARYLDAAPPGGVVPVPGEPGGDEWLATGDVFEILPNGYYRIVDRIKDIYKNTRGETVAPLKVESKFAGVPGIKRTFLVGDGRPHNVLFIVPDYGDAVLRAALDADGERAYYRRIVGAANLDLAPYERVVNFAVLDRDFEEARGELTTKGSYNRKRIEAGFAAEIEALYRKSFVELEYHGWRVRIPHWFYRDLGVLEDEIFFVGDFLFDSFRKTMLPLAVEAGSGRRLIGDLEYRIEGAVIDLGVFARQPRLWFGNPALARFCPCRAGWDVPAESVAEQVFLPASRDRIYGTDDVTAPLRVREESLLAAHKLASMALFGETPEARAALIRIEGLLAAPDLRIAPLLRARLEASAGHPEESIRCDAYRILLLDEPNPEYDRALTSFVHSGLSFLNEASIEAISSSPLGPERFDALRRRMAAYRESLAGGGEEAEPARAQFLRILRLFVDFARYHPDYYRHVRAELASWALHRVDPELSRSAVSRLSELDSDHEGWLGRRLRPLSPQEWEARLAFDEGLPAAEVGRIRRILTDPTFLPQSIGLVFGREGFDPREIPADGIWVSRLPEYDGRPSVRVHVRSASGEAFDLRLITADDLGVQPEAETLFWHLAIANYPLGEPILPRIGSLRPGLGAVAILYSGRLNVWERLRLRDGDEEPERSVLGPGRWRTLAIEGMAAFFKAWRFSGGRIVPGLPSPTNVMVAEASSPRPAMIHSLAGWRAYEGPLSLVRPLIRNFFLKTAAHYPWLAGRQDVRWLFDACYEALGYAEASAFFQALAAALEKEPVAGLEGVALAESLSAYLSEFRSHYMIPLPAVNAVRRYKEWELQNAPSGAADREGKVLEVLGVFGLDRYPEAARYYLYRQTYFAGASEAVLAAFDKLLGRMTEEVKTPAVHFAELSDLQAALADEADRAVFAKMVFPRAAAGRSFDIRPFGEDRVKQVIVRSAVSDRKGESYEFAETFDPAEIGQLYRLFYLENYPKTISQQDRHYILRDSRERVMGGLCYRLMSANAAFIDGIVIASALKGRGLGGAMIEEFCQRMSAAGIHVILTHFYLPGFFLHQGFREDKRWGSLVREL